MPYAFGCNFRTSGIVVRYAFFVLSLADRYTYSGVDITIMTMRFANWEALTKMRHKAFEVNEIFNIGNEKAVFRSHVLNVFLQAVTYVLTEQALLEAESFTGPSFIRISIWLHL